MASSINSTSAGNGGLISTGDDSGILNIQTNETTAISIDASQRIGIGTTSPSNILDIVSASNPTIRITDTTNNCYTELNATDTVGYVGTASNHAFAFTTNNAERMRIDTSGNLLVGTTTSTTEKLRIFQSAANNIAFLRNSNATTVYGIQIEYSARTPNTTGEEFIYCGDTAPRFTARSNGGIANYSANNVNLSDRREKTNFAPAKSYLDVICAIPVQTFNYIDQNMEEDGGLTLGVIAQDVQAVAPELVMESNWANRDAEPKMRLSIYQTDLQYALMKSIQELKAMVDSIQSEFDAYKATHP